MAKLYVKTSIASLYVINLDFTDFTDFTFLIYVINLDFTDTSGMYH